MIERYGSNEVDLAEPVEVRIGADATHAGVSITDLGGGLRGSAYSNEGQPSPLFEFFFTTSPPKQMDYTYSRNFGATFDGLGFGVPMVDLHATMMGGGLQINSLPGHSTSAVIRLAQRGGNAW